MEEKTLVIEYEDAELEALIIKHKCNDKRYRKLKGNASFWRDLDKVMGLLRIAHNTSELAYFKVLHYEKLKYDRSGQSSVRIGYNSKFRLIFEEFDGGIRIKLIEINEHYGDK